MTSFPKNPSSRFLNWDMLTTRLYKLLQSRSTPQTSAMLAIFGLTLLATVVLGQMHPVPPPPPYNIYGPISPYGGPPMLPPMPPYPASTSVSFAAYPLMAPAAATPYQAYGLPPPPPPPPPPQQPMSPPSSQNVMYPPPYQTFSGSGPMGDPFTTSTG